MVLIAKSNETVLIAKSDGTVLIAKSDKKRNEKLRNENRTGVLNIVWPYLKMY